MNSAVSKLSNTRTFGYFRYKVKSHKSRLIITSIMVALTYPLFFFVLAMTYGMDGLVFGAFIVSSIPIGFLAMQVYLIMGIVIPVTSMPYLHKRTMADLGFSIPLSTKQRFWGDFFAGLFVYTIPYIISMIVGIVIYLFPYLNDKEDMLSSVPPWNVFTYMLSGLVIAIMIYILSYFVSVFTGSSAVASIYILIVNVIIPITLALVSWAIFTSVYGVDYTEIIRGVISTSSPIGLFVGMMINLTTSTINNVLPISYLFKWDVFIPIVLIFGVILVVTYYVYKMRKAEQTGQPFAFKSIYNIILFIVMFTITSGFATLIREASNEYQSPIFLAMVVTTFITYFVLDIITRKDFDKYWFTFVKYVGMIVGSFALISFIFILDGFGMTYTVPKANQVSSVTVNYDILSNNYAMRNQYYSVFNQDGFKDAITITEPEVIQNIIDIQQDLIDKYDGLNKLGKQDIRNNYNNFKITYKLKTGGKITRSYYIGESDYIEELESISKSKGSKDFWGNFVYDTITATGNRKLKEINITDVTGYNSASSRFSIPRNLNKKLAEALRKDMQNEKDEDIFNSSVKILGYINLIENSGFYYSNIPIKESYENTVAFINENGGGDLLGKKISDIIESGTSIHISIKSLDNHNYNSTQESILFDKSDKKLAEILDSVTPYAIDGGDYLTHCIYLDSSYKLILYIPKRYEGVVAKYISKSHYQDDDYSTDYESKYDRNNVYYNDEYYETDYYTNVVA